MLKPTLKLTKIQIINSNQYRSVIWPLDEEQRKLAIKEYSNAKEAYRNMELDPPLTIISEIIPNEGDNIDQWIQREFKQAEGIHQKFWTKLQLKFGIIVTASLFQEFNNDFMINILSPSLVRLILIWLSLELLELGLATAESLGLKQVSPSSSRSGAFAMFNIFK